MFWLKNIKEKIKNFNFFELGNSIIIYYLLNFYLGPLLAISGLPKIFFYTDYQINYKTFLYLTIGLLFLALGYFSPLPKFSIRRLPNVLKSEWNFRIVPWVFSITFIMGIAAKILRILNGAYLHIQQNPLFMKSSWYGVIGYLDRFLYIALAIAFISYFSLKKKGDRNYCWWRFAAWGTFLTEMIYALPTCGREQIITPILIYLILKSYLSNISWRKIVIIGLLVAVVVFPLGNFCRSPNDLKNYSVVGEAKTAKGANIPMFIFNSFIDRIDQSVVFSKILEKNLPFLYGKSLLKFFIAIPPRILWKNKPAINVDGNAFAHRLGLISPEDSWTNVGPMLIGDWYLNFGLLGIIFGMFFMGFLWRIFYEYLIIGTNLSLSGVLIYSIVWVQIVRGLGSEFAPVYAGLVKFLIILSIIHFFLTKKSFKKSE